MSSENVVAVSKEVKYLGARGMVGAPSMFYFTVSSISEGNTVLSFEYKRLLEKKRH